MTQYAAPPRVAEPPVPLDIGWGLATGVVVGVAGALAFAGVEAAVLHRTGLGFPIGELGAQVLFVYAFIELAKWPGKEARRRGHKYADAIAAMSWGGLLLTAGLAWLAALVWAKSAPAPAAQGE